MVFSVAPAKRRPGGRAASRRRAFAYFLLAIGSLTIVAPLQAAQHPWPENPNWQKYIPGPSSQNVYPVKIVSVSGNVSHPEALLNPNASGVTTLTTTAGSAPATIVIDYGKDTNGFPWFDVASVQGTPTLLAAYSEGLQYLSTSGDQAPSQSQAGDSSRADSYAISAPGKIINSSIQGGERFEVISLTSPGSITLQAAGIQFAGYKATAADYHGYFVSSSDELNQIWFSGAYTDQLDQIPAHIVPGPWKATNTGMIATGGDIGLLTPGMNLTDYTMTFSTQILNNQSGWVVRAQSVSSSYLFILDADNDTGGAPNTLQVLAVISNGYVTIGNFPLPSDLKPQTWHTVQTVVSGNILTVSLDGTQTAKIDVSTAGPGVPVYSSGGIGFREFGTESAEFRDLSLVSAAGTVVYENALATAAAIGDFNLQQGNVLPLILDGAKRDRVVWGGDISVEGPTLFYSTAANDYIKSSLLLLGSYQLANGEAGSNISPVAPVGTFPETQSSYSAPYSMYFVTNLAQYYRFTDDQDFVRTEWPIVQRELQYVKGLSNTQHLFVSDASDGMDWHYYDGPITGAVTAYNALYYKALTDGAFLARAANHADLAAQYNNEATLVRTAINSTLFNATTGVYDIGTNLRGTVAQDANSLVALYDIVPAASAQNILSTVIGKLTTLFGPLSFSADTNFKAYISPFASNMELQALFHIGDTKDAFELMHQVWGEMIAPGNNYTGADWELIGTDGLPGFGAFTSLAHGWASGATSALSGYVLGIQPVEPGFKSWIVQPHPGTLQWVEGQAATPHGPIAVKWGQNSSLFAIEVDAPRETSGTIAIPTSNGHHKVVVNGKTAWENGHAIDKALDVQTDSEFITLNNLPGGHYDIQFQ